MIRANFIAALGAATVAATTPGEVTAQIDVTMEIAELLAPFSVSIAVRNRSQHVIALDFPSAELYRIDVRRADITVWSTATGHKPLQIARRIDIAPGLTRLASQIVDGTTDDRRAYAPGRYDVHVALLGADFDPSVDRSLTFREPLPIAAALKSNAGNVVTIAGDALASSSGWELHDQTGSIRLSRPLALRPSGTYVVRGYRDATGDDVTFAVGRFAPAFDNPNSTRPAG